MARKANARCPLQAECERKCAHEGYEMSDDEIALRNGTHELFSRK